jgi:hypothetical protein
MEVPLDGRFVRYMLTARLYFCGWQVGKTFSQISDIGVFGQRKNLHA